MAIMHISFGVGLLISVFFAVLLAVEFHQDKVIDRNYTFLRKTKQAIGNGAYECQSCGNRRIKAVDKQCGVCSIDFDQEKRNRIRAFIQK